MLFISFGNSLFPNKPYHSGIAVQKAVIQHLRVDNPVLNKMTKAVNSLPQAIRHRVTAFCTATNSGSGIQAVINY